jgi:hypothetical protein
MRFGHGLLQVAAALAVAASASAADSPAADRECGEFTTSIRPRIATYCLSCHDRQHHKHDVVLEDLGAPIDQGNLPRWTDVRNVLDVSSMPPDDEPQPTAEERDRLIAWIRSGMDRFHDDRTETNGNTLVRRINNRAYQNIISTLLDVPSPLIDQFPSDGTVHGFDTVGEGLGMTASQTELYFENACQALSCIDFSLLGEPRPETQTWTHRQYMLEDAQQRSVIPTKLAAALAAGQYTSRPDDSAVGWDVAGALTEHYHVPTVKWSDVTAKWWADPEAIAVVQQVAQKFAARIERWRASGYVSKVAPFTDEPSEFEFTAPMTGWYTISVQLWNANLTTLYPAQITIDNTVVRRVLPEPDPPGTHPTTYEARTFVFAGRHRLTCAIDWFAFEESPLRSRAWGQQGTIRLNNFQISGPQFAAWPPPIQQAIFPRGLGVVASVLADGSFETPSIGAAAGLFQYRPTGSPWVFVDGSGISGNNSGFTAGNSPAPQGAQVAFIQGIGSLSQRVTVESGTYELSFRAAQRVNFQTSHQELAARIDGRDVIARVVPGTAYQEVHASVALDQGAHELSFVGLDPGGGDNSAFIDDVGLTRVSEVLALRSYAQEIIARFMTRATAGACDPATVASYTDLVMARYEKTRDFVGSIKLGLAMVLSSPRFLYLCEDKRDQPETRRPLTGAELARRLAYALWSDLPDEALTTRAADGGLRQDDALRAEVDRMLADPRSRAFRAAFTSQWLRLDRLGAIVFPIAQFPKADKYLKQVAVEESVAFFSELLDHDLSIRNFIDSDFAMLDWRLAELYGIPDVIGSTIRRVALPPGSHRGGVITQASVLMSTSNGMVTSPVKRGVLFLERFLGDPPGAPPPNVPAIDKISLLHEDGTPFSPRERFEAHRHRASCARCHSRIDPPGLALENFDPMGRWITANQIRIPDAAASGGVRIAERAIAPDGALADGSAFKDIDELKQRLLEHQDVFVRTFVRDLMIYLLGRDLQVSDTAVVDAIIADATAHQLGLRRIVEDEILSAPFRTK